MRQAAHTLPFLALIAGLSPAMWSRGLLPAVAVALPFWAATADRVAPTILAAVRVVLTWLVAVIVLVGLRDGFTKVCRQSGGQHLHQLDLVRRGPRDRLGRGRPGPQAPAREGELTARLERTAYPIVVVMDKLQGMP